jgi:hypothetical protein
LVELHVFDFIRRNVVASAICAGGLKFQAVVAFHIICCNVFRHPASGIETAEATVPTDFTSHT